MACASAATGRVLAEQKADSSFLLRTLSAVVLIPLALYVILSGGWLLAAVILAFAGMMTYEWSMMTQRAVSIPAVLAVVAPLSGAMIAFLTGIGPLVLLAGIAAAALLAATVSAMERRSALWPTLGAFYVTLPAVSILWLREGITLGHEFTMALFVVVWATDIGAYLVGRLVGGPKLAPRISPKKTWSGLAGGMLAAALALTAMGWFYGLGIYPWFLLFGAFFAVWGQIGDLAESAIKRRFNVKDSGAIIPGHGGILDRVDGLVFVAPVVALMMIAG